jgi:UDP-2-acetamido-2,6-beta-L-arabino-hexul-4-ose reductase
MHYVYIQDVVDDFISIVEKQTSQDMYIEPKKVYETTLGEVVDFIDEFKENIKFQDYKPNGSEFKQKLFETYLDYYRNANV